MSKPEQGRKLGLPHAPNSRKANAKKTCSKETRVLTTWLTEGSEPIAENYSSEKEIPFKIGPFAGSAPGPPGALVETDHGSDAVFTAAVTTSLPQPVGQGAISTFQSYYLRNPFRKGQRPWTVIPLMDLAKMKGNLPGRIPVLEAIENIPDFVGRG